MAGFQTRQQFGAQPRQPMPIGRPAGGGMNPFEAALLAQARLRQATTPAPMAAPRTMAQPSPFASNPSFSVGPSVGPTNTDPSQIPGGGGYNGGTAPTLAPTFSHTDATGTPIYSGALAGRGRAVAPPTFATNPPVSVGPSVGPTNTDPSQIVGGGGFNGGTTPSINMTAAGFDADGNPIYEGAYAGRTRAVEHPDIDDREERYKKVPGYEWVTRGILDQFDREAARAAAEGYTEIQFTDWARTKGYNSTIDRGTVKNMPPWMRLNSVSTRPADQQTGIAHNLRSKEEQDRDRVARGLPPRWGTIPTPPPSTGGGASAGAPSPSTAGGAPVLSPPSSTTPPSDTGTTTTSASTTASQTTPAAPTLGNFNEALANTVAEVEKRYQPSFDRDRNDLQQRLLQTGAVTGALNAGGFSDVVGDEMVNLAAKQSAQLGEEISKQTINATQLAMTKYVAELENSFKNLELQTNADLQRKAQELQKYGIDQNVFMDKYKADLALKGVQYSSDAQVNAASMQAAASAAASQAQLEASRYNADRDYQLGLVNADITRENNIFRGMLEVASWGSDWAKLIFGSDPLGIFTGGQIPGDVVVKP